MKRLTKSLFNFFVRIFSGDNPISIKQEAYNWDRQYMDGKWDFLTNRPVNTQKVIEIITSDKAYRTKTVLDIGCGNGGLLIPLSEIMPQNNLYGIDVSKNAVLALSLKLNEVNLISAPIEKFPGFGIKFDVVVLSEILYYIDYDKVLNNLAKYAKSDSKIIISVYDSWRSPFIWMKVSNVLKDKNYFCVSDTKNKWKVMVGKIKV